MTIAERIFQAVLFEVIAIILSVILLKIFINHTNTLTLSGLFVAISLIAMMWNFIFNWGFDKYFSGEKTQRPIIIRALHAILFEGILLILTLPLIMFTLKISLWQAFIMDILLTIFILIYTFIFHWIYDHSRIRFFKKT